MEKLFNYISDLFFEHNIKNNIRYPLIIIILTLFVITTFCLFSEGIILSSDNIILAIIFIILGFIFFLGSIIKIKNLYFAKNNVK